MIQIANRRIFDTSLAEDLSEGEIDGEVHKLWKTNLNNYFTVNESSDSVKLLTRTEACELLCCWKEWLLCISEFNDLLEPV